MTRTLALCLCALVARAACGQQLAFVDATAPAGLANLSATRLALADLNHDGRPDAIIRQSQPGEPDRYRIFRNEPAEMGPDGPRGVRFVEIENHNLPIPRAGDCLVFADLDNDGWRDALFVRYLDINADNFTPPPPPVRTCWLPGRGDGTFGDPILIEVASPATSACVAIGDLDMDGTLDIAIGNWYTKYGASNEAFPNTYLRGRIADGRLTYEPWDLGIERPGFNDETDDGGRPTYGIVIAQVFPTPRPQILELNYGRRWNRLLSADRPGLTTSAPYADLAPSHGFDGDAIRHGRYPEWLRERARTDPRFDRADEKPFRANGNTFDAAVGDIDNDGDFDIFLAEITHGWAGESSDRSRFLINRTDKAKVDATFGGFESPPHSSVDRLPRDPTVVNWNQGDLFAELADFDHDGRLDLLLSSGDYPDTQRLRLFRQQEDGSFRDITDWVGLNNEGSAQIAIGDVDLDGDLDILVGQSFNRLSPAQIGGRVPTVKLYLNQTVERRASMNPGRGPGSITLLLRGDPSQGTSADALNAVIHITAQPHDTPTTAALTLTRQLLGPGGHAGKQGEFLIHAGIGDAASAEVHITWPGSGAPTTTHTILPGRHEIRLPEHRP
jgi:hypothetical protein